MSARPPRSSRISTGVADSPERLKRALEERKRIVKPTRWRSAWSTPRAGRWPARSPATTFIGTPTRSRHSGPRIATEATTSDARGELALKLVDPGPPGRRGRLRDPAGRGRSARRPAEGHPRGDPGGQAGHGRDASGLPRPPAGRVPGLPRAGREVSCRAGGRELVAGGLRLAGRESPGPAPAVHQLDEGRARVPPAARPVT